ncbi:unnamed protein product [Thlaspi arvense]|uniref:SET domain-containing protein n=1 Tax=Thlaspi arvense TaxID=13288 RepID=A0AAU9SAX0_THLAR|nr:unnamed protein product [Thlaspi arvense]
MPEDKEAERRTGNNEYLFDIGNKYDNTLAEGMSKLMPGMEKEEEDGAAHRICMRRTCQYDHEDKRIPHVMLFAMDNIPPFQELTYHYNYMIDLY